MIRISFLILVLLSFVTFAQTQESADSVKIIDNYAYKPINAGEFGYQQVELFNARLYAFLVDLNGYKSAKGLIINYGSKSQIARNELIIRDYFSHLKLDSSKVKLIKGGFVNDGKTEFWIVPEGIEFPKPTPYIYKFDEYRKISSGKLKVRLSNFIRKMLENDLSRTYATTSGYPATVYIVIYAPNNKIQNQRVRDVQKFLDLTNTGSFFDFDLSRITYKSVKSNKEKTEFWIVPKDAEPPQIDK